MKKLLALIISFIFCRAFYGCSGKTPRTILPTPTELPHIPQEMFAVKEITPDSMAELEYKLSQLTVQDFLHSEKIATFERRGIDISVENIARQDCNTITFEMVLCKKDGATLRLPAIGILMYQYLPMNDEYICGLHILWGNMGLYDDQIVFTNINTMSLWDAATFKKSFRQPELSFITKGNFCFILDAIKDNAGYTLTYYSKHENGFAFLSDTGRFINTQILTYSYGFTAAFGGETVMASRNYNTNFRARTLLHTFYGDRRQKQLYISCAYIFGYYGPDYTMYNFDNGSFTSAHPVIYYNMPGCEINVFGMIDYNNSTAGADGFDYIAVKKEDGVITGSALFKSDLSPTEFGMDTRTGWNNYLDVTLDSDMNNLTLSCRKANAVMDIDFAKGTAQVYKTTDLPQMLGIDNSPNSQHMLYRSWSGTDTSVVVRILSGYCRMDHLADVHGSWGVDWLAGFSTHRYVYILTKNEFKVFSWEGSNDWILVISVTGNYDVNSQTVQRLCNTYL